MLTTLNDVTENVIKRNNYYKIIFISLPWSREKMKNKTMWNSYFQHLKFFDCILRDTFLCSRFPHCYITISFFCLRISWISKTKRSKIRLKFVRNTSMISKGTVKLWSDSMVWCTLFRGLLMEGHVPSKFYQTFKYDDEFLYDCHNHLHSIIC